MGIWRPQPTGSARRHASNMFRMPRFFRFFPLSPVWARAALLALAALGCLPKAQALPVSGQTVIQLSCANGAAQHYTIGVFSLSAVTAAASDPDFAIQALQADNVTILRTAGQASSQTEYTIDLASGDVGVFILRDGTLRDFSLGKNLYRPLFSVAGSTGSNYLSKSTDANGALQISFAALASGVVMGSGAGTGGTLSNGITLTLNSAGAAATAASYEAALSGGAADAGRQDAPQPVVPEPATLAMAGLGVALMGILRRRQPR